ncbi:MAG: phosphopantetheine-binding protein [Spirochaetaceae bacterium]|jgi:acyl carrier protein|nr:phosphopantetheine-binding protein [Spirochaetaceae bacterium]
MITNLEYELKKLIISALDLEDFTPEDIETESPLFGGDLGLDSIDALELGIAIKKKYNVSLSAEDEDNRKYFYSIKTLVDFINERVENIAVDSELV